MNEERQNLYTVSETGPATYNLNVNNRKKKPVKGVLVFAVIVLIIIGLAVLVSSCESDKSSGNIYPSEDFIAKVEINGVIGPDTTPTSIFETKEGYSHSWTMETIEELIDEESNKGLMLYINTPGGAVYETDELYLKIKEYQKKTKRPVYAVMGNIAASGGYYIAAPSDKIIANRNTWTGSIGVTLGNMVDISQFLNEHGVKVNTITSGANKAMGNSMAPMTDEQRAIFQSMVDEAYEQFAQIVAEGRKLDLTYVKKVADGRIYTAKQAKAVKLIDEIATYEEACKLMKKEKGLKDVEIVDMKEDHGGLFSFPLLKFSLASLKDAVMPKSDIAVINDMIKQNSKIEPQYYCEELAK